MAIQLVKCPKCGSPMRKRSGKYGEFWGCSSYPKCTATLDGKQVLAQAQAQLPKKEFTPSAYQLGVFQFIQSGTGNAFVGAVAGSGKTTTIVKALDLTPKTAKVAFVAFNKHIADELSRRAPGHVKVATLHSLGFSALRAGLPYKPEVDESKLAGIVKELLPNWDAEGMLRSPLARLVSLAKGTLTDPEDRAALDQMALYYDVDLNGDADKLMPMVPQAMRMCMERTSVIDYDDMIWLPIVLNMHLEVFDWLFVDEAQDLNSSQLQLVLRSVRPHTGRVVAVGDKHQSIYGFRGADVKAVENLVEALNATVLPLSISYRCPISHVNLAKEIVPEIEAAPDAEMGLVEHASYMKFLQEVKDGDLVLCRVNAPLVKMAYTLVKMGKKVVLRGRDFGKGLQAFIDKLQPNGIDDLMTKVRDYQSRETARLTAAGKDTQIESLVDKCDCIVAMCDGMANLSELRSRITSIFDDESKTGIIGSSVHRAKGDESFRVWIVKPELMPHPMATQEWQQEQEQNIKYVALTRSKRELVFVSGA